MLAQLLSAELASKNISIRAAAREIGLSHTSIYRVLKGKNVDLLTLEKIALWMNIPLALLANTLPREKSDSVITEKLNLLLFRNPSLKDILKIILDGFEANLLLEEDIEEILNFAAFKIVSRNKSGKTI